MNEIKIYISQNSAEILLRAAQDSSFLVDRPDWTVDDQSDLCFALARRDTDNKLTLTAKQFDWFCAEADWAIGEAHG
jgi:hypothetical protein